MKYPNDSGRLYLTLVDGKIVSYFDVSGIELKGFHHNLTLRNIPKIYILKEGFSYLYVGFTMQSLASRIKSGLAANGKRGYHGYKWKSKKKVELFVWHFPGLDKIQMESIEAELVYLIRQKTGSWPLAQNEIHFNNDFKKGKLYAREIMKSL